jgi:biotin transport system substrate-specific component
MTVSENVKKNSLFEIFSSLKKSQLFWILSFTVLTFLSAQVEIPTNPVPFTLQTMLVILAGAFLGSKNGALSLIIYLTIGAIGLPVFAGFGFGFAKILGPTGGYLISFPFAAFLVGYIIEKRRTNISVFLAFFAGLLLILLAGASYLSIFMNGDLSKSLFAGALIFSVWDLIKCFAAFSIYKSISKKYHKLPG